MHHEQITLVQNQPCEIEQKLWGNVRPHDSVIDATTQIMQYIIIKPKREKKKKRHKKRTAELATVQTQL